MITASAGFYSPVFFDTAQNIDLFFKILYYRYLIKNNYRFHLANPQIQITFAIEHNEDLHHIYSQF